MSRILRPLVLVAFALSLAACDSTGGDWPFDGSEVDAEAGQAVADADALQGLRAEWDAERPAGYWLRYEVICFCAPTVVDVRVIGDQVFETRLNGETPPTDVLTPLTMLDLYDLAISGYGDAAFASARVRPGSPPLLVSLSIDGVIEIADDEVSYIVRAYAPLSVAAND